MSTEASRKDKINFVLVMLLFMIGMVVMIIYKIENTWVWIGYIIIWTWVEVKVAKNFHLKWWVWVLILAGLSCLDFLIIKLLA